MQALVYIIVVLNILVNVFEIIKLMRDKSSRDLGIYAIIFIVISSFSCLILSVIFKDLILVVLSIFNATLGVSYLVLARKFSRNIITLCGVSINFNNEALLLNCVVDSKLTSDSEVLRIVKGCDNPNVLKHIELSDNKNISRKTKELAHRRYIRHYERL